MHVRQAILLILLVGSGCDRQGPEPPSECPDPFVAPDGLTVVWSASAPFATGIPLVTEDLVVMGGYEAVYGFDRRTCSLKWEADVGGDMLADGPPLEVDGVIVVPQRDLVALDPTTGALQWRFPGDDGLAGDGTPTASGDTVFAATVFGWVYAVSAGTGTLLWKTRFDSLAIFHPTVAGDALILGTRGRRPGGLGAGFVIALNRADGTERWRFPLPDSAGFGGGAVNSGLAVDGMVIIGSMTTRLYALDVATGTLVWEQAPDVPNIGTWQYRFAPRLLGKTLIALRANLAIEGRSPADGTLLWTLDQGVYSSVPAIGNGLAYFFNGELAVVDEAGQRIWSGGGFTPTTSTAYVHGTVTDDGTIYAITYSLNGATGLRVLKLPDLP
jgi:outer membrane protein assembly factor BamB